MDGGDVTASVDKFEHREEGSFTTRCPMKNSARIIELFLRLALAAGFLSAVSDRFGWWSAEIFVWGNWSAFLEYTGMINPWLPASVVPAAGWLATIAEAVLALLLIVGYRTELVAKACGYCCSHSRWP